MKAVWVIAAVAVLSFGQTPAPRETPPTTKKATAQGAKPDTWQKSKECASQAEKMIAEWPSRTGSAPADWNNHYSPKYDKCFVKLSFFTKSQDEKVFPTLFSAGLYDAFERSAPLASSCTVLGHQDCVEQIVKLGHDMLLESVSKSLNGKSFAEASATEQEAARTVADQVEKESPQHTATFCGINGEAVDCAKAESFISEHMKK